MGTTRVVNTRVLNPTDPINELIFFGSKVKSDVTQNLIAATIDGSIDMVTQISLDVYDPGFRLMRTGIYEPKTPVRLDGYMFETSNLVTGEQSGHEKFSVKCRPRAVRLLKKRTGKKVYTSLSPSEFVERECKAVGIKAITQNSGSRKQIARDVKSPAEKGTNVRPSTWTTFQRLAGECGFVVFEWGNIIYFGKPTWLLEREKDNAFHVHWGKKAPDGAWTPLQVPVGNKSEETKVVTIEVNVPVAAWKSIRVGGALKLSGVPGFNGTYLISALNYDLVGAALIVVQATTPENPPKVMPVNASNGSGAGRGGTDGETPWTGPGGTEPAVGTGSVSEFVQLCLSQSGDTYIFGAEANPRDPDPSAFDCSELIEWAAARTGVYIPDGSSAQIGYSQSKGLGMSVSEAINTFGALLYKPGHIAVSLGNGESIEAVGTGYGVRKMSATSRSFSWTAGGRIPGMRY